ncbi:hypothetical protein CANARDRAFT_187285, partial [[Candida] arabinofermentans NRRL YB-2248]
QHEKLRHRLQDELSNIKSTLESTDYDWFLRGSNLSNSSHLNSNTNSLTPIKSPSLASSNTTKAPPSVSTTEAVVGKNIPEPALIPLTRSKTADATLTRRRASDVPTNTGLVRTSTNVSSLSNSAPRRRRGSFFKKLFGTTSPPRSRMGSLSSASPRTPSATRTPSSRRASLAPKMSSQDLPSPMSSPKLQNQYKDVVDPKLYEYLKDLTRETTNQTTDSFDSSTNSVFAPSTESSIKYEIGVIPPHPDKPKLPSAFSLHPKYNKSVELEMYEKQKREKEKEKEHFKEGSINTQADDASVLSVLSSPPVEHTPPPPKVIKAPAIQVLRELSPMKKVAFATTTFVYDPPQQIPSRHPRKGNVEVGEDGELIIHKVDPEEKQAATAGLVVGGTAHLKMKSDSAASMNSLDTTINKQDKLLAAQKAREHTGAEENDTSKDKLTIDKPMVKRNKSMDKPVVTLKLDELSDMDWSLFTATMIVRGGLEEIILSGCKINDLEVFKNLMYLGLPNIKKLGLAYNELSLNHCNIIVKWMTLNHDLVGIDIGYNDLGSYLKPFIEYTKQADNKNNVSLISLNTCSLLDNNDTQQFFDAVSKLPQLKYLDISNNKKLFPSFMSKLISYLPLFSKLTRLNLDNNALTPIAIIQLSETLPLIKNLNYLSLTGNKLTEACYVSLCHSLKNSRSIFTFDFDKDDVPQKYQEKIGLLTMKNMERALYGKHDNASTSILSDTTKQAKSDSFEGKSFSDIMIDINNSTANKEVVANFIKHADSMRKELHSTISELVELQVKGTLTFEGKETLIRLITIDSSILKGLELINSSVAKMYEPSDATKLLNNIVETDQNKDRDSDTNSDSTSATLNENENDNEAVELKDDSIPSVKLARSSSAASLMAEEEAKTFKDVNLIKKASSQSLNTSVEDCSLIDKLSSSSDAIDLVQIINNLKSAGLTLTDLYTKRDDD